MTGHLLWSNPNPNPNYVPKPIPNLNLTKYAQQPGPLYDLA